LPVLYLLVVVEAVTVMYIVHCLSVSISTLPLIHNNQYFLHISSTLSSDSDGLDCISVHDLSPVPGVVRVFAVYVYVYVLL